MISETLGVAQVRHLLAADDEHGVAQAGGHLAEADVEARRAGRRGRLDPDGRDLGNPRWVATLEAKLPSPRNSSGFMVATTMASGRSRPASASAVWAASAMRSCSGSLRLPILVMPAPATNTRCMKPFYERGPRRPWPFGTPRAQPARLRRRAGGGGAATPSSRMSRNR